MAANFENFKISLDFPINFRKVTKFQRIISKALRVIDRNLWRVPKDPPPGLSRVKTTWKILKSAIGKTQKTSGIEKINIDEIEVTDIKVIAEKCNE